MLFSSGLVAFIRTLFLITELQFDSTDIKILKDLTIIRPT